MSGNVWASPLGDRLVTRGGDVFTAGDDQATDMIYVRGLSASWISSLAYDAFQGVIFTGEGSTLRYYNLFSYLEIGSEDLTDGIDFLGFAPDTVYAVQVENEQSTIVSVAHPVPNGSTNTAPQAAFDVTPASGGTTLTDFMFDASSSTDAEDDLADLLFRWDFDNDALWRPTPRREAARVRLLVLLAGCVALSTCLRACRARRRRPQRHPHRRGPPNGSRNADGVIGRQGGVLWKSLLRRHWTRAVPNCLTQ